MYNDSRCRASLSRRGAWPRPKFLESTTDATSGQWAAAVKSVEIHAGEFLTNDYATFAATPGFETTLKNLIRKHTKVQDPKGFVTYNPPLRSYEAPRTARNEYMTAFWDQVKTEMGYPDGYKLELARADVVTWATARSASTPHTDLGKGFTLVYTVGDKPTTQIVPRKNRHLFKTISTDFLYGPIEGYETADLLESVPAGFMSIIAGTDGDARYENGISAAIHRSPAYDGNDRTICIVKYKIVPE